MTVRFLSSGKVNSDHSGSEEGKRQEKAGWPREETSWEANSEERGEMAVAGVGEAPGRDLVTPRGFLGQVPMLTCAVGVAGHPHLCDELGK